jgi:hypothetical protein
MLETEDASDHLGRQPDLLAEHRHEMLAAPPNLLRDGSDP